MNALLLTILLFSQAPDSNIITLDEATIYCNGYSIPDANVQHRIELISFITVLKFTQDSLKTNISFDKSDINLVIENKHTTIDEFKERVMNTNSAFRTLYISNSIQMLQTVSDYKLGSIEQVAEYLGVKNLKEYVDFRLNLRSL